jgi:hypothetical protein
MAVGLLTGKRSERYVYEVIDKHITRKDHNIMTDNGTKTTAAQHDRDQAFSKLIHDALTAQRNTTNDRIRWNTETNNDTDTTDTKGDNDVDV